MRAAGRCGAARTQAPAYARYLITVAYRFNNGGFSLFFSSAVCVVIFNNNEHPPPLLCLEAERRGIYGKRQASLKPDASTIQPDPTRSYNYTDDYGEVFNIGNKRITNCTRVDLKINATGPRARWFT